MDKKTSMKELAKIIKNILKEGGYDSPVRLYQDLSVECHVYGHTDIRDYVISKLMDYPQFEMDSDFTLSWKDGRYIIYITIV